MPPIVIIDDDPFDVLLLKNSLAATGVEDPVLVCSNGREALTWLTGITAIEGAASRQTPQLMFVDLRLPEMDGVAWIRLARAQRSLDRTTIVAVSGSLDPEDAKRALAAGADHFVPKPADADTISALIDQRQQAVAAAMRDPI